MGQASVFLIGAGIGYSQGSDEPGWFSLTAGNKAFIGGGLGILPGALMGAELGSIKIVIPIRGSMDNYKKYKYKLERRMEAK